MNTNINHVTHKKGFYISKNPLVNETALCFNGRFWILNGITDVFDDCKTLEEAKQVFRDNIKNEGSWSDYRQGE